MLSSSLSAFSAGSSLEGKFTVKKWLTGGLWDLLADMMDTNTYLHCEPSEKQFLSVMMLFHVVQQDKKTLNLL